MYYGNRVKRKNKRKLFIGDKKLRTKSVSINSIRTMPDFAPAYRFDVVLLSEESVLKESEHLNLITTDVDYDLIGKTLNISYVMHVDLNLNKTLYDLQSVTDFDIELYLYDVQYNINTKIKFLSCRLISLKNELSGGDVSIIQPKLGLLFEDCIFG